MARPLAERRLHHEPRYLGQVRGTHTQHVRAVRRERPRGHRPGDHAGQVEHPHAAERPLRPCREPVAARLAAPIGQPGHADEREVGQRPRLGVREPLGPAPHRRRTAALADHGLLDFHRRTVGARPADVLSAGRGAARAGRQPESAQGGITVVVEIAVEPDPAVRGSVVPRQRGPAVHGLPVGAEMPFTLEGHGGVTDIDRDVRIAVRAARRLPAAGPFRAVLPGTGGVRRDGGGQGAGRGRGHRAEGEDGRQDGVLAGDPDLGQGDPDARAQFPDQFRGHCRLLTPDSSLPTLHCRFLRRPMPGGVLREGRAHHPPPGTGASIHAGRSLPAVTLSFPLLSHAVDDESVLTRPTCDFLRPSTAADSRDGLFHRKRFGVPGRGPLGRLSAPEVVPWRRRIGWADRVNNSP